MSGVGQNEEALLDLKVDCLRSSEMKRILLVIGVLLVVGYWFSGPPDGPFETYYENGQLWTKGTYKDGQIVAVAELDGLFERYHPNGQLWRKSFREGGVSMYESYYENGQLSLRATSNKENMNHGPYENYYESGQVREKGTFNMGERCGQWIENGWTVTYDPCPPGLADGN